jgi:hypothetical protein
LSIIELSGSYYLKQNRLGVRKLLCSTESRDNQENDMRWNTFPSLILVALTAAVVPTACSAAATLHNEIGRYEVLLPDTDPISGEWDVTFHVHESTTPGSFTLKLDGDKVSGTAESAHTGPGTVRDGSWKDNKLSFILDFKKHESIAVTGILKDGKLSGEFSTEGFTDKWEAIRKGTQTKPLAQTRATSNDPIAEAGVRGSAAISTRSVRRDVTAKLK